MRGCRHSPTSKRIGDRTDEQQRRIRLHDLHPHHARKTVAGDHRPGVLPPLHGPRDGVGLAEGLDVRLGGPRAWRSSTRSRSSSNPTRTAGSRSPSTPSFPNSPRWVSTRTSSPRRSRTPIQGVVRHRTRRRRPGEADRRPRRLPAGKHCPRTHLRWLAVEARRISRPGWRSRDAYAQPSSTGRRGKPRSTRCGSARRRTPAKVMRSRRPGAGCRWSRWTASTPLVGPHGPVTLLDAFEGRRQLIAYYFMWHTGHSARRTMRRLHMVHHARRRAVLPSFPRHHLRGVLPGPVRREQPLPRLHGLGHAVVLGAGFARHLARRAPERPDAPRVLPAGRRPRLRDLLDELPRRGGDGLQLRAHGPHGVRASGGVGGLAEPAGRYRPIANNSRTDARQTGVRSPSGHGCEAGRSDELAPK